MATAKLIETHSRGAEICRDAALCREKLTKIYEEFSIPGILMPLDDFVEVGINRSTGFLWIRQKNKKVHKFKKIGKTVTFDVEITCFIEPRHMKNVTGIKGKELMIPVVVCEMIVGTPTSDKVKFISPTGFGRAYPIDGFEPEK